MKEVLKININFSSDWIKEKSFCNEEIWEREHLMDSMWHTSCILDAHYE